MHSRIIGSGLIAPAAAWTPASLSGLHIWLDAGNGAMDGTGEPGSEGAGIATWTDLSGNGYNATQATGSSRPAYRATSGPNSLPAIQTDGTDDSLDFADVLSALTNGGEVFAVMRSSNDPGVSGSTGHWTLGLHDAGDHYPFTDGSIYDSFGTTLRKSVGNPVPLVNQWRLYNVVSVANEWTARIDGTQLFTTASNTVGWRTTPALGKNIWASGTNYFAGYWAEFILYNRKLTTDERTRVNAYVASKYAMSIA